MASFKITPDLENITEGLSLPGIIAIAVLPLAIPLVARFGKSITKTAIKGGIIVYEKSKGLISGVSEAFEDIVAEAKAELAEPKNVRQIQGR
ncbi:MAG: DUF5132 domain-containing protein [Calothrix sp. C42_A2020_038]|nr:DUF5132 domain-containing protein [Calothrix sp. C42_A2020_038]